MRRLFDQNGLRFTPAKGEAAPPARDNFSRSACFKYSELCVLCARCRSDKTRQRRIRHFVTVASRHFALQRLADVLQHIVRRRHHFGVHLVRALHRNHRHHFVDDIHVRTFQRVVLQSAKPIFARYAFGRLTAGGGFQIQVVALGGKPAGLAKFTSVSCPNSVTSLSPGKIAVTVPSSPNATLVAPAGTSISGCNGKPCELVSTPSAFTCKLPSRV